jgi:hypothetical protein
MKEKQDMEEGTTTVRSVVKPRSIEIPSRLKDEDLVHGQVVDLAFVNENLHLAEIISWAAAPYMDILVVANEKVRLEGHIRDPNIRYWEVDRASSFHGPDRSSRTTTQIASQQLPIELPIRERNPSGNPKYMVRINLQTL